MNILLLTLLSGGQAWLAVKTLKLRLLSPTFLSSIMFFGFAFIYLLNLGYMGRDISLITLWYVFLTLFLTYLGELVASKIVFKKRKSGIELIDSESGNLSKLTPPSLFITVLITIVMLVVAYIRYRHLQYFASRYGSFNGLIDLLKVARVAVNQGEDFNLGGGVISQIVYLSTGVCFYYTYAFLHELIIQKNKVLYLLLPVIADVLIELSTTGRTSFIIIIVGFIVSYFHIVITYSNRHKFKINKKLYYYLLVFLIIFFAYGSLRTNRSETLSSPISGMITSYSSASIYGLDEYLRNPWQSNDYFAAYTGKFIFATLGIEHSYVPNSNLPFFFYGGEGYSNIYTAIVLPLHDYGLLLFMVSRIVLVILSTWIISALMNRKTTEPVFYVYLLLSVFIVYSYINAPIADRFYTYFLNPIYITRVIAYTYFFSFVITKIRWRFRLH